MQLHLCSLPVGWRTTCIISRTSHIVILVSALVGGRLGQGIGSIALFWPEMHVIKAEYESGSKEKQGSEPIVGAFCILFRLGSHGNCIQHSFSQLLLTSLAINGVRTRMKGRMPWCTASQLATPTQSGSGARRRMVCPWWVRGSPGSLYMGLCGCWSFSWGVLDIWTSFCNLPYCLPWLGSPFLESWWLHHESGGHWQSLTSMEPLYVIC